MKETLLKETKIGEHLAVSCEMEGPKIGLVIASLDISVRCAFKFSEWCEFVRAINEVNDKLERDMAKGQPNLII